MLKNNNYILISLALFLLLSCKDNVTLKDEKVDPYSRKYADFHVKGKFLNPINGEMYFYYKNSNFDSLILKKEFLVDHGEYIESCNCTSFFLPDIDYHFDFELNLNYNGRISKHKYSNIQIESVPVDNYFYFKIIDYKYNGIKYKCDNDFFVINEWWIDTLAPRDNSK
jgi:hypothetical protein